MRTVLYVEDSSTLVNMVKFYFEQEDYKVISCENADDAIEIIQSGTNIDAFIFDIVLRGGIKTGYNLVMEVRKNAKYTNKPIIMTSSRSAEKSKLASEKVGADLFMAKPFIVEELYSEIERLIQEKSET